MKRTISHLSYFAFLIVGAYIAFRGIEDFGLLLFGQSTDATIQTIKSQRVRVGKRGHAEKHYAKYVFTAADNQQYHGSGEMESRTPQVLGGAMPIRYLSFNPSVNAPKNDVIGTGVLLTAIGVFLFFVVLVAWRRKIDADQAARLAAEIDETSYTPPDETIAERPRKRRRSRRTA